MKRTLESLVWQFGSKAIDFLFRRRTAARIFTSMGIAVLTLVLAGSWAGKFTYRDESRSLEVSASTSDGFPAWVAWVLLAFGVFCLLTGFFIAGLDWWQEKRRELRSRVLVVELRGLHATPDTPLDKADLELPGSRELLLHDFRPASEQELVNPDAALRRLSGLKDTLKNYSDGHNRADIKVAVGGLAPVPALVLAGSLLDDESEVTVFDWDRSIKVWRRTDQADDGVRLLPLALSQLDSDAREVVLAVSASYAVQSADLDAKFGSIPRATLATPSPVAADRFWSAEKQQAYVVAIRDAMQQLTDLGIKRIHLVLAAPASLSIRVGMAYERRLFAEVVVYQYERSVSPAYPWGFLLPSSGNPTPAVVR